MKNDLGPEVLSCTYQEGNPKIPESFHKVTRTVYEMPFTRSNLKALWDKASKFPVLFWEPINGDYNKFAEMLLTQEGDNIRANGLFWIVDDFIGAFFMTNIDVNDAQIHYSFFDKRHAGRHKLCRAMIKYVFNKFGFHRLSAELPKYLVQPRHFAGQVGMKLEGTKREAIYRKDQWYDVDTYGILKFEADSWDLN